MRRSAGKGFTLIELMIAIAIIAILATLAIPSYSQYVRKSRRADAIATLLELQIRQEKWRANNSTYGTTADMNVPTSSYYTYTVENPAATTYTLKATATSTGGQGDDKQSGTTCTPLTLTESNAKSPAACWQ
ncbi:MAG: type IV pilin protein [Gammaproteobacteria bacterium]|nr:type IV pilin protein [Gammaproteobacteria bacterium]